MDEPMPTNVMTFAKFDAVKRERYLGAIRQGCRLHEAAKRAGVSHYLVSEYNKQHPEFITQVQQAEVVASEQVENALMQKAIEGNVVACLAWLFNRSPDRWKDKRNVAISTNTTENEALKAILERLKEKK